MTEIRFGMFPPLIRIHPKSAVLRRRLKANGIAGSSSGLSRLNASEPGSVGLSYTDID